MKDLGESRIDDIAPRPELYSCPRMVKSSCERRWHNQHQAATTGVGVRWLPGLVNTFVAISLVRQAGGGCDDWGVNGVHRDHAT